MIKDLLVLSGRTLSCLYIFAGLFEGKQNRRCSFAIILTLGLDKKPNKMHVTKS